MTILSNILDYFGGHIIRSVYLLALVSSSFYCFSRTSYRWQIGISLALIASTWYYIIISDKSFVEAYADVAKPGHWSISSQLLAWSLTVSVVFYEANVSYLVYGVFGCMSASFVNLIPNNSNGRNTNNTKISGLFLPTVIGALYTLYKLPISLQQPTSESFTFWLTVAHLIVLIPTLLIQNLSPILDSIIPKIDSFFFYSFLSIGLGYLHIQEVRQCGYIWPQTDCQKSVFIDFIGCSLLSVYFIYKNSSFAEATVATLMMPLLSPSVVLCLFMVFTNLNRMQSDLVTSFQRKTAIQYLSKSDVAKGNIWMNLGLRMSNNIVGADYAGSCEQLALKLGERVLRADDEVLCCGCGYGVELRLWHSAFKLFHITGIDSNQDAVDAFETDYNIRMLHLSASDIKRRFLGVSSFNKILALDSIYHFGDKAKFFDDCFALLPKDGTGMVGVTDVVLRPMFFELSTIIQIFFLVLMKGICNIPMGNMWSIDQYKHYLESKGFVDVNIDLIGEAGHDSVMKWCPNSMLMYLGYVAVTACVPKIPDKHVVVKKPKVAIIGSGISGLTAAHNLAHCCDVTIFEKASRLGYAGHRMEVQSQVIDMPLRVNGKGHYVFFREMVNSVGVKMEHVKGEYCIYSKSSTVVFSSSIFKSLFALLPHCRDAITCGWDIFVAEPANELETVGEWLHRKGYHTHSYKGNSNSRESPVMDAMLSQACWMLSCSYEEALRYPVGIILRFLRSGRSVLGNLIGSLMVDPAFRIVPSIHALELALTYGCRVQTNSPISSIGIDRVISNVKYDQIVIATEATVVSSVLGSGWSTQEKSIFEQFPYSPSTVIVHQDPSLMPENRSEWKTANICHDPMQDGCMLTIWLNSYFPQAKFEGDVFQSWNPHRKPRNVIKEVHMQRVAHTKMTAGLVEDIAAMQGRNSFHFCGAYVLLGMGLQEEATISGYQAAQRIINHQL